MTLTALASLGDDGGRRGPAAELVDGQDVKLVLGVGAQLADGVEVGDDARDLRVVLVRVPRLVVNHVVLDVLGVGRRVRPVEPDRGGSYLAHVDVNGRQRWCCTLVSVEGENEK